MDGIRSQIELIIHKESRKYGQVLLTNLYLYLLYKLKGEAERVFLASSKHRHVRLPLSTKFHIILLFLPIVSLLSYSN
jgi:hypothetical protein